MAGPFYIDSVSGGDTDGLSWANAWISPNSLPTLASGEIVYVDRNSVDAFSYSAARTWVGPTSGAPAIVISVTSGGTTYTKATTDQFYVSGGAYDAVFTGGWAFYGIQIRAQDDITFNPNSDGVKFFTDDCKFIPGDRRFMVIGAQRGFVHLQNFVVDLTNDGGASTNAVFNMARTSRIQDFEIQNGSNRTGEIFSFGSNNQHIEASGGDVSSCTGSGVALVEPSIAEGRCVISNIKTAATYSLLTNTSWRNGSVTIVNCGPNAQPEDLVHADNQGELWSDTTQYRTGGATIEGVNISWGGPTLGIETSADCSVDSPFYTPFIYGSIAATGTYTFDVYISHSSATRGAADLDDDEIWLEVEYKDDATSGEWMLATDRVATRTTTPTAQTDDTGSTWQTTETYHQRLSVSGLTVGTTGMYRARVAIAVTSLAAADDLYIDPLVTVT